MNKWEQNYKNNNNLWGIKPENTLEIYQSLVKKGKILDLGIGEGRNSLLFAKEGFEIEGVDISQTALIKCEKLFKNFNCKYSLFNHLIENYKFLSNNYSLVISSWSLNFMKKTDAINIFKNAQNSIISGGIIYLGVFTQKDPQWKIYKDNYAEIENDTFYNPEKNLIKTFLLKMIF